MFLEVFIGMLCGAAGLWYLVLREQSTSSTLSSSPSPSSNSPQADAKLSSFAAEIAQLRSELVQAQKRARLAEMAKEQSEEDMRDWQARYMRAEADLEASTAHAKALATVERTRSGQLNSSGDKNVSEDRVSQNEENGAKKEIDDLRTGTKNSVLVGSEKGNSFLLEGVSGVAAHLFDRNQEKDRSDTDDGGNESDNESMHTTTSVDTSIVDTNASQIPDQTRSSAPAPLDLDGCPLALEAIVAAGYKADLGDPVLIAPDTRIEIVAGNGQPNYEVMFLKRAPMLAASRGRAGTATVAHTIFAGHDDAIGPVLVVIDGQEVTGHQSAFQAVSALVRVPTDKALKGQQQKQAKQAYSVLVRSAKGDEIFRHVEGSNIRDALNEVRSAYTHVHKLRLTPRPDLLRAPRPGAFPPLQEFERKFVETGSKFGFVYIAPGQIACSDTKPDMLALQDAIFGNLKHSGACEAFLQLIADRIELNGFSRFSGGLNTRDDSTGTDSFYTSLLGQEIMLHVSTLLPHTTSDAQQIERKRHIGNDVVVIVFNESGAAFNPAVFVSDYNHVFLVVEPVPDLSIDESVATAASANFRMQRGSIFFGRSRLAARTQYRFSVVAKPGVEIREAPPSMHFPCLMPHNESTRKWFLTKAINLERVAIRAPAFASRTQRTRTSLLAALVAS